MRLNLGRTGLWRHPDFLRLWAAESVSQVGSQLTLVALPLIAALTLGASPLQMGILTAAGTAPFLIVGLFVGVWVDRLRRRPILVAADLGRAVLLCAIPVAWMLDQLRVELLYGVAFLIGVLTVFFNVAYVSYLPSLVGRAQLIDGNSKLQASASVAQIGGPGLGGALIGLVAAPLVTVIDAVSFLVSAAFLGRIRANEPEPTPRNGEQRLAKDIGEGLRTVVQHPWLRAMAACSATTNLFGFAFLAVYVLYMTDELGLGPTSVGIVFATGGLGALIGSLLAGPAARKFGMGPTIVGSQLLVGLGGMVIPFAVLFPAIALPMVIAAECVQWMMLLIYDVNALSLRQAVTPDRLQGRVTATIRFMTGGMQPIGALLGGLLGELIGVPGTLIVGVLGMLAAFLWVFFSSIRSVQEQPSDSMTNPGTLEHELGIVP